MDLPTPPSSPTRRAMEKLFATDTCALPTPPAPPPASSSPPSSPMPVRGRVAPLPPPPSPLRHSNALNTAALQPSIVGDAADGFPRSASNCKTSSSSSSSSSTRRSFFSRPAHVTSSASSTKAPPPRHAQKTVIIVVNVLPLVFERNAADTAWDVEWSSSATSLFYRNLVATTGHFRPLFLGCPEVFIARNEEATVEKQLRGFDCVPVFLDPQVAHRYFQGFCKGVLWPVFHNVVDVYNSAKLALDEPKPDAKKLRQDGAASSPPLSPASAHKKATWCDPASWNPAAQDMCWADYCSVNRTFARRVIETYNDGYMVWIHDFHFLMLPSYLLRKLRSAMIAIYLHVPFPSSEIFRCLAMRTEILRAMLCADHIGFLIFEHARHFLTSCKRLLGLNYKAGSNGMLEVDYNGRHVSVSCSHIEPDVTYLHTILDQHHTDRQDPAHKFRKRIEQFIYNPSTKERKFVITSVDRLEGLSALPLKLRAFDRFLAMHPAKHGSVVLIQIGISLDSRPNDYHQTRDYVQRFAAEINRRYSTGPAEGDQVVYFEEKPKTTCAERMHLWRMSDAYLDTCVRFGLSLLPFEYLVAQKRNLEQSSDPNAAHQFGTMIVSEFASYSRILNGCVLVNPWKTDDIVKALVKATEMQYYEKLNRFQVNHKFLELHAQTRWAERLLADFEVLEQKKQQTAESRDTVEVGFGFDFRVMQFASGFVKLDIDEMVNTTTRCARRLFIFDYGGTLSWTTSILEEDGAARQFHQHGDTPRLSHELRKSSSSAFGQEVIRYIDGQVRTSLSDEARDNIRTLCEDPHNIVFVVSTGRRAELDAEFGSISKLNLVADNGLFVKKIDQGSSATTSTWECICEPTAMHMEWKAEVRRVMQSFSSRTNGAFLIEGEASLLYDYRNSDPEYGEIQALELYDQLCQMIKKGEATIHRAKGFVEVHQFGVSKAVAVSLIAEYLKNHVGTPDFAFYAGDDESDELAIKAMHAAFSDDNNTSTNLYTCTVGMKPSNAKYYVDSVTDILALVHAIAVRARLESQRGGVPSMLRSSYLDRFVSIEAPLVDIAYLRKLANDALGSGDELSSDMALAASRGSGSPRDSQGSATLSPPAAHLSRLWTLSAWTTSEWLALGAGVAVGAALTTMARPFVHGRSARAWVAKQLQHVADTRQENQLQAKLLADKNDTQMTRSAHATSSPPRVLQGAGGGDDGAPGGAVRGPVPGLGARAREGDSLLSGRRGDREFATFCSISLTSEPRGSKSAIEEAARLQEQYLQGDRELPGLLRRLRRGNKRGGATESGVEEGSRGCCSGVGTALYGAAVSVGRALRLLQRLRLFALLCVLLFAAGIAGVVWAVVMTADADWYLFLGALVSLAFSSIVIICYAESRAVRGHPNPLIISKSFVDLLLALLYVFEYAATQFADPPVALPVRIAALTQALLVCGEFWFFAMPIDMVQSITNPFTSYAHNNRVYWFYSLLSGAVCGIALWVLDDRAETVDQPVGRFFWFHENTDRPGFWWHHWLSYHMWVLVYLVFAVVSVVYVKRRLRRGLEETFDVRRRVLSSGLLTCWIYITWSFVVLALFVVTNLPTLQQKVRPDVFEDLVNLSAFLHSARGGLNIIVWLVINSSSLHAVCFRPASRSGRRSGVSQSATMSTSTSLSPSQPAFMVDLADGEEDEEEALLNKPELNTSLRRQMIQMATSGIIESVEHYHRLHRRIASNQTFHLDWQRSPQRARGVRRLSASASLAKVVATRNSTIRVVEADDDNDASAGLSAFLPLRMREMQFYDFQPRVFASTRQLHGIQDAEYIYAFRHTMNERMSEGRSGAFVFTTSDRKYLVKSTTAAEKNVLLKLLPSYVRYLKWNPKSLLPKFFGFHAMKMYGQVFYFVVMGNVLNTNEVIHRRYDIKGSWVDRNAPACVLGERYRCSKCNRFFTFGVSTGPGSTPCEPIGSEHYPDITLRDNDLKKRIKLESDTALQLVKQLTRDSNFLASMGIMDYSLLVGAHYSHFTITPDTPDMRKEPSALHLMGMPGSYQREETRLFPSVRRRSTFGGGAGGEAIDDHSESTEERGPASGGNVEASGYVHNLCDSALEEDEEAGKVGATDGGEALNHLAGLPHDVELGAIVEASGTTVSASGDIASGAAVQPGRHHHRYRAHQVSGPSTYYFGLVDILQKWTLAKQTERAYKVHVLRKSARGVSAVHPKAYAARFQQKMHQLFMTTPAHLLHQSQSVLDGAPRPAPVPHDDDEEEDVGGPPHV